MGSLGCLEYTGLHGACGAHRTSGVSVVVGFEVDDNRNTRFFIRSPAGPQFTSARDSVKANRQPETINALATPFVLVVAAGITATALITNRAARLRARDA